MCVATDDFVECLMYTLVSTSLTPTSVIFIFIHLAMVYLVTDLNNDMLDLHK